MALYQRRVTWTACHAVTKLKFIFALSLTDRWFRELIMLRMVALRNNQGRCQMYPLGITAAMMAAPGPRHSCAASLHRTAAWPMPAGACASTLGGLITSIASFAPPPYRMEGQ